MSRPNAFSLKIHIILSLGLMLLPTLAGGALFFYCFKNHVIIVEHLVEELIGEKDPVFRTQALTQQAFQPVIDFILTGDVNSRVEHEKLSSRIEDSFFSWTKKEYHYPGEENSLSEIHIAWEEYKKTVDALFLLDGDKNEERDILWQRIRTQHLTLQHQFNGFQKANTQEIVREAEKLLANKTSFYIILLSIICLGLILSLFGGFLLSRLILTPLQKLYFGARQWASGNIDHRIEVGHNDELGLLIHTFNWMANELKKNQQKLHALATSDPLTGLVNHREFYRILENELDRAARYRHELSVLMMDMNDFKEINDTMGHLAGDHVLREVAMLLRKHTRKSDLVSRYGGDEFSILLPETEHEEAIEFAARLSQYISEHPITITDHDLINISMSIGTASYPRDGKDHLELVAAADKALYKVKRAHKKQLKPFISKPS